MRGLALGEYGTIRSTNLNLVTALERADHRVEDGLDNDFAVAPRQVARTGHFFTRSAFVIFSIPPLTA